jgi:hypothetical protein
MFTLIYEFQLKPTNAKVAVVQHNLIAKEDNG